MAAIDDSDAKVARKKKTCTNSKCKRRKVKNKYSLFGGQANETMVNELHNVIANGKEKNGARTERKKLINLEQNLNT